MKIVQMCLLVVMGLGFVACGMCGASKDLPEPTPSYANEYPQGANTWVSNGKPQLDPRTVHFPRLAEETTTLYPEYEIVR